MDKRLFLIILLALMLIFSCGDDDGGSEDTVYREYMREFVQNISAWAKTQNPGFLIIPQNGHQLSTFDEDPGNPCMAYINAIDGAGQEDLFYGYNYDNVATPQVEMEYLLDFLNLYESNEVEVLVIDYCSTVSYVNDSYAQSNSRGYISTATERDLDSIPTYPNPIYGNNTNDVTSLSDARNFLYLLDPTENFTDKGQFVSALSSTNYDLFVVDLFYDESNELDTADTGALDTKPTGSDRLVICYMSIGEAEDYRYYWDPAWETNPPSWLREENPEWEGNYKVEFWNPEWQAIIYGNASSYLQYIINAGFDGVYLDIIDAFEYFE